MQKTYLLLFFNYVAYVKLDEPAANQFLIVVKGLEGDLQSGVAHVTICYFYK